jgi:peptidoglycan/xylan/chitin deacetylase (PgdA/CDA1 family)
MISRRRLRRLLASALAFVAILGVALWTAPRWLVPRIAAAWPGCLYSVHTNEKAVAFTFDDGPDSGHTDEILEMLKANDAHATFFFVSSHVPGNEAVLTRLVAQGHEIGNHLTRVEPSIRLSPAAFDAAVREAGASLSRFGPVRWLRPGRPGTTPGCSAPSSVAEPVRIGLGLPVRSATAVGADCLGVHSRERPAGRHRRVAREGRARPADRRHAQTGSPGAAFARVSHRHAFGTRAATIILMLSEGRRPSDPPTRSLARRFAGALHSRGSLAAARSRDGDRRFMR